MGPDSPRKQGRLLGQHLGAGRGWQRPTVVGSNKLVLDRLHFSAALWWA